MEKMKNFTMMTNVLLDNMAKLNPIEYKVTCHIYRQTKGWNKDVDTLAYSQIAKSCGLSLTSVSKALKQDSDIVTGKQIGRAHV